MGGKHDERHRQTRREKNTHHQEVLMRQPSLLELQNVEPRSSVAKATLTPAAPHNVVEELPRVRLENLTTEVPAIRRDLPRPQAGHDLRRVLARRHSNEQRRRPIGLDDRHSVLECLPHTSRRASHIGWQHDATDGLRSVGTVQVILDRTIQLRTHLRSRDRLVGAPARARARTHTHTHKHTHVPYWSERERERERERDLTLPLH